MIHELAYSDSLNSVSTAVQSRQRSSERGVAAMDCCGPCVHGSWHGSRRIRPPAPANDEQSSPAPPPAGGGDSTHAGRPEVIAATAVPLQCHCSATAVPLHCQCPFFSILSWQFSLPLSQRAAPRLSAIANRRKMGGKQESKGSGNGRRGRAVDV
jgi:hypothetical protein